MKRYGLAILMMVGCTNAREPPAVRACLDGGGVWTQLGCSQEGHPEYSWSTRNGSRTFHEGTLRLYELPDAGGSVCSSVMLSPEHAVELGEAMVRWGATTGHIDLDIGQLSVTRADLDAACTPGCLYVGGKLIACGACDGGR
jgi:hypothetical protein